MAAIPNDYKEALGRVIVLTSISTEPAQSLRLCRSVMTLTSAGLKKKRGKLPPEFLKNFLDWRQAWDKQAVVPHAGTWIEMTLSTKKCSDTRRSKTGLNH